MLISSVLRNSQKMPYRDIVTSRSGVPQPDTFNRRVCTSSDLRRRNLGVQAEEEAPLLLLFMSNHQSSPCASDLVVSSEPNRCLPRIKTPQGFPRGA